MSRIKGCLPLQTWYNVVSTSNTVRPADYRNDLFGSHEADLVETLNNGRNTVERLGNKVGRRCRFRLSTSHEERNAWGTRALHETDCTGELNAMDFLLVGFTIVLWYR